MKLKNILIVVTDIEKSKAFYRELFGLQIIHDFGENVIMTEGLVLQEIKLWKSFINKDIRMGSNDAELYFEENNIEQFLEKLKSSDWGIEYVNKCIEHDWGQRVIRIYDPDLHMIEIGESLDYVARRFLKEGMSVEETAGKIQLPVSVVDKISTSILS